jgi:SAM-dependent methyltransferase
VSQTAPHYDTIGRGYAAHRQPDPRIAARIWDAVGDAARIVNVGAGAGSYERPDWSAVAVEPSTVMIGQRHSHHPVLRGHAEALPFDDLTFDVALASMTIHHWADPRRGLAEIRRVARRQVIFTFDAGAHDALWIFSEYFPQVSTLGDVAPLEVVLEALVEPRVEVILTPADCSDGFGSAYWRRPEQYLDPGVRAGISALAGSDDRILGPGLARLEADLASGEWARRHADLLALDAIDAGLRLVVAGT